MNLDRAFLRGCALAVVLSLVLLLPVAAAPQSAAEAAAAQQKPAAGMGEAVKNPLAQAAQATGEPGAQAAPAPPPGPAQAAPQQEVPEGPAPLRVMVSKSLLVNTRDRLKRVSVTDPTIADALVVTPTQLLIHGRAPGEVSLVIWDEAERSQSFDLRVDVDISAAAEEEKRIFPHEKIEVSASRSAIVLSGHVAAEDDAKRAGLIAEAYSKNVINVLTFGPLGAQEVLLEVKFAEADRGTLTQLAANILSTGAGNTIGATSTGQFSSVGKFDLEDKFPKGITGPLASDFKLANVDPLNFFIFNPNIHLGAAIKALQDKNVLQILAEPNLIALNGKEASFLAGGEFPYPVPQAGTTGTPVITIVFKEFGVRLSFTPLIMPDGAIHLKVKPEVSTLDFANGVTINNFVLPAISTRRAETELQLQDGQSFVIAGLMDNRVISVASKIPGLGDLPIIGYLFRSKNLSKNKSELMVLVTVHLVSPTLHPPAGPTFPKDFLDQQKFDNPKSKDAKPIDTKANDTKPEGVKP